MDQKNQKFFNVWGKFSIILLLSVTKSVYLFVCITIVSSFYLVIKIPELTFLFQEKCVWTFKIEWM